VRYADAFTSRILYAGCMPLYDVGNSASLSHLLGVNCMDVSLLASEEDIQAAPDLAWEQMVCEMSDISKKCRPVELTECHLEQLRAEVSADSVCSVSVDRRLAPACPCLDRACQDDEDFLDEEGYKCWSWIGDDCSRATEQFGYTSAGQQDVIDHCPRSCRDCEWLDPCPYTEGQACLTEVRGSYQCQACQGFVSGVGIDEQEMCCPDDDGPVAPKCSSATATSPSPSPSSSPSPSPSSSPSPSPQSGSEDEGAGEDTTSQGEESEDGSSMGIILGAVAGVLVLLGLGGGVLFYMTKKKSPSAVSRIPAAPPVSVPSPVAPEPEPSNRPLTGQEQEKEFESNQVVSMPIGAAAESSIEALPSSWAHQDPHADFFEIEPATELVPVVQRMLDETFKSIKTRDRKGGVIPKKLQVVMVQRVENNKLWQQFCAERRRIDGRRGRAAGLRGCTQLGKLRGGDAMTMQAGGSAVATGAPLNPMLNETYLWHGTSPQAAMGIAQTGFDVGRSGSGAGMMYGPGVYLAECSSKSDEYAADDTSGLHKGMYSLLLCRTVLGELLSLTTGGDSVHGLVKAAFDSGSYDSVLGDREASAGTYREFICPRSAQVMPEYIVLYNRVPNTE